MWRVLLATCFYLLHPGKGAAQAPFWAELARPGIYPVGFRVIPFEDESRPYREHRTRPLPVYLWYPATSTGAVMSYGRYVELMADEAILGDAGEAERQARRRRWEESLDRRAPGLGQRMTELVTGAHPGAPPAHGPFPLVIYVPGLGGSALENVALVELLASHGHVVAAIPSLGKDARTGRTELGDLEAQARDIEAVVGAIGALPEARSDGVIAAGWSWGGLAAMLAQMRDRRIGAVVSLDGSVAYHLDLARRAREFDPSRADVPYLMLVGGDRAGAAPEFFDELRYSDAYYITLPGAGHVDVTTRFGYLANEARRGSEAYDEAVPKTYSVVLESTAAFVSQVSRPSSSRETLALAGPDGAPALHRSPEPSPPPAFRLLDALRDSTRRGLEIYRGFKRGNPDLRLFREWDLVDLAFELFNALDRPEDAIEVGRLLVEEYPDSYAAHGYLAELYRKHEAWAPALAEFSAALALGESGEDSFWTTRSGDLAYYRRMVAELQERLSGG